MSTSVASFVLRGFVALILLFSLASCETTDLEQEKIFTGGAVADTPLALRVEQALKRNSQTKFMNISVTANGDVVVLKGIAGNDQELATAEQVASAVQGVRHVNNNLYILK